MVRGVPCATQPFLAVGGVSPLVVAVTWLLVFLIFVRIVVWTFGFVLGVCLMSASVAIFWAKAHSPDVLMIVGGA